MSNGDPAEVRDLPMAQALVIEVSLLRNEVSGEATRYGAPVELFLLGGSGEAVGFLSEALRNLVSSEPLSSPRTPLTASTMSLTTSASSLMR